MSHEATLSFEDARHLRVTEGWLELGDAVSASEELEEITLVNQTHPAVLKMRFAICEKREQWDMATEVAGGLTTLLPDSPETWINLACATRRKPGDGIPEAKRILLVAQVKFPREYLILFKLACYCAQLGELADAERWLKKAMAVDKKTIRKLAREDRGPKLFWDSINGKVWKRE